MLKKYTAILFLLSANFILFAHAVIPHHHHEGHVCIESILNDEHRRSSHDHHPENDHSAECHLHQPVVLPDVFALKHFIDCKALSDKTDNFQDAYLIQSNTAYADVFTAFRRQSSDSIHVILFANSPLSLRAPPVSS